MSELFSALHDNLQSIYRKAVDADNYLDEIQKDGKGKFVAIFPEQSPFTCTSKRFLPYVQELAENIEAMKALDEAELKASLPNVVKKVELLLATLLEFKQQA